MAKSRRALIGSSAGESDRAQDNGSKSQAHALRIDLSEERRTRRRPNNGAAIPPVPALPWEPSPSGWTSIGFGTATMKFKHQPNTHSANARLSRCRVG